MKKTFFFLLSSFALSCANQEQAPAERSGESRQTRPAEPEFVPLPEEFITIPKNADSGWYNPKHGLKPGDVVVLEGNYSYISLDSVIGTPEQPIIFKPKGIVKIGANNSYAWIITSSKHFVIDGVLQNEKYGFRLGSPEKGKYIAQSFTFPGSDNFEIKGVEIANAEVGFFSNPATGGPYQNIRIHDNYVHDLDNPGEAGRSEAFYIGNTGLSSGATGGLFYNLDIYNNVLEELAGDGIQVAMSQEVNIRFNTVRAYGKANLVQQRSAIILGGCTSGTVESNIIEEGTGSPFQCFGGGEVFFKYNKAKNVALSEREDGFYIDGKCGSRPLRVHLIGNTIEKVSRDFIRDASESVVEERGNVLGQ